MWSASTLLFAGLFAGPPVGAAAEPATVDERARSRAQVTYRTDPDDGEALATVLKAELAGMVDVDVDSVDVVEARDVIEAADTATPGTVARVWIVATDGPAATLFLVDELGERILIRKVPLAEPGRLDEVAREQVAAIVVSAVEALLDGARIGIERQQARTELGLEPEPEPEPTTSVATSTPKQPAEPQPDADTGEPPLMLWLELGYQQTWARPVVGTQGPRLALDLEHRSKIAPGGTLAFTYQAPASFVSDGIEVLVQGLAIRGAVGVAPQLGDYVRLRAQVGAGVDLLFVDPRRSTVGVSVEERVFQPVPMAGAMFGVTIRVVESLELRIAAVGDVDLVDTRFLVEGSGGARYVLYDPWRVRPGFRLSLAWDTLGKRGSRASRSGGV